MQHLLNNCYDNEIDYYTSKKGLIPYEDVLSSISNTNTILEIVQGNQSGPTLRYFESVSYNKKLLTNNENVTRFPYYDERYMRIFKKPEDIDYKWVKDKEYIDYHYNGDFSPIYMINRIEKDTHV